MDTFIEQDMMSWIGFSLRNLIIEIMKRYHTHTINTVFPEYYSTLRSEIDQINGEIAKCRNEKDVGNKNLENFTQYLEKVKRLEEIYDEINNKQKTLNDYEKKRKIEILKDPKLWIAIGSGTAVNILILIININIVFYIATFFP